MEALSIELKNIEVRFQAKEILTIDHLAAYQNDRIGIVGRNGQGKSTLLNVISGLLEPNSGEINRQTEFNYYRQMEKTREAEQAENLDPEIMGRLKIPLNAVETLSGGEETKYRLVQTLSQYQLGLLLDEPTTHLDQEGIRFLMEELMYYYGTLIIVSHDRYFLDQLVTKIWEVDNGKVREYAGNYSDYVQQKEQEKEEMQREADKAAKEKKRLTQAVEKKKQQAQKMSHVSQKKQNKAIKPDRLSSSKQKDTVQKNIQKTAKAIEKRLEQIEEVQEIREAKPIHFPTSKELELHNRFPVMGDGVNLYGGTKKLLEQAHFQFPLGKKVAITGSNGTGKSTLLKHILADGEGITLSPKVVFSTYQQMDYKMTDNRSIMAYVMTKTDFSETTVRAILNNLGFSQMELTKPVHALSGGEATRIAMALIFVKPSNVLILDEPTNFVDVQTIEALEGFIGSYPGTVIFTSHDRYFVERVADQVWEIQQQTLSLVKGSPI